MKYKTLTINSILFAIILFPYLSFAQPHNLKTRINKIIKDANGKVGAAIMGIEQPFLITFNDSYHYPMQSVYKFPLALKVLSEVDKGKLALNQNIHLTKNDLKPNTWSPLRKKYPDANVDISLKDLLEYTVSKSDNNGCDILFRLIGGTQKVDSFIHQLGINKISISANEEEMHKNPNVQFKNWSTPSSMAKLFYMFSKDSVLSKQSKKLLMKMLVNNIYGASRIKGKLPKGTIAAHKTGSSGKNKEGIAEATNDAGIVTLPNGNHFIIVVFVSHSKDGEETRDKVIADISKAAWDYFVDLN